MPICTVGSSLTARKAGHRAEVAAVSAPNVRCARAHRRFLLEKGTVGFFLRGIASQNAGAHRRIVVLCLKRARSGLSGRESRPESTIRPCRSAFSARNGQPKAADGERLHFRECGGSCERRWPFGHLAFGWAGCGGAATFSAGPNERGPDDERSTGPLLRGEARRGRLPGFGAGPWRRLPAAQWPRAAVASLRRRGGWDRPRRAGRRPIPPPHRGALAGYGRPAWPRCSRRGSSRSPRRRPAPR